MSQCKVSCQKKILRFRAKILYLGILRPQFEKTVVIIEINTLEFVKMQCFMLSKKKYGTKFAFYRVSLDWNLKKKTLSYLKSTPLSLSKMNFTVRTFLKAQNTICLKVWVWSSSALYSMPFTDKERF